VSPALDGADDEAVREANFFQDVMDPFVNAMVTEVDPWDAYNELAGMRESMVDYLDWGIHGSQVLLAWTDLADLYVTGETPIEEAHAALRQAAGDWLAKPALPDMTAYIEGWIARAAWTVSTLVERDGDSWRPPT
jgi:hypothetical protein